MRAIHTKNKVKRKKSLESEECSRTKVQKRSTKILNRKDIHVYSKFFKLHSRAIKKP